MAIPLWLKTVRSLLRDLKLTDCTRPHPAQLEHLRVTIHPCNEASDPNHRPCVSKFIEDARQVAQTRSMAALFSLPLSTRFRSEYLSSLLMEWVEDIFSKQIAPRVLRVERTPKMRIPNDSYSLLQAEMMARVPTQFPGDCMDISVVIRKELMPEAITSAELYALLWMASDRVRREPRQSKIKVRMLVIHSHLVQAVTATTTRSYITSIVSGCDDIKGQMEIFRTPWFSFIDRHGQQRALLCALEAMELDGPCVGMRIPLSSMQIASDGSNRKRKRNDSED